VRLGGFDIARLDDRFWCCPSLVRRHSTNKKRPDQNADSHSQRDDGEILTHGEKGVAFNQSIHLIFFDKFHKEASHEIECEKNTGHHAKGAALLSGKPISQIESQENEQTKCKFVELRGMSRHRRAAELPTLAIVEGKTNRPRKIGFASHYLRVEKVTEPHRCGPDRRRHGKSIQDFENSIVMTQRKEYQGNDNADSGAVTRKSAFPKIEERDRLRKVSLRLIKQAVAQTGSRQHGHDPPEQVAVRDLQGDAASKRLLFPDDKADIQHARKDNAVITKLERSQIYEGWIDIPDKCIHFMSSQFGFVLGNHVTLAMIRQASIPAVSAALLSDDEKRRLPARGPCELAYVSPSQTLYAQFSP
jgi:hypothetical protein